MTFPFFFHQPSEEDRAKMEEERKEHELRLDEFRHSSQRLFDELSEDQLTTLSMMLHIIADQPGPHLATMWEGMALTARKYRFDVCATCNVNHDTEIQKAAAPKDEPKTKHLDDTSFDSPYFEMQKDPEPMLPIFGDLTDEDRMNMAQYHLDDVYEEGTGVLLHFACTGIKGMNGPCGATYPTIEDRMLKEPENCSGCHTRMAHG
jgi:hypothetical protein